MSTSSDSTMGAQPATTDTEPAFTVFSAYNGKVYACCVTVDVAMGWAGHYAAQPSDLLGLEICNAWRSHPDAQGIAAMRVS